MITALNCPFCGSPVTPQRNKSLARDVVRCDTMSCAGHYWIALDEWNKRAPNPDYIAAYEQFRASLIQAGRKESLLSHCAQDIIGASEMIWGPNLGIMQGHVDKNVAKFREAVLLMEKLLGEKDG